MEIKKAICTNNDCYKANKTITVQGGMLHSVGCPQPKASVFQDIWNRTGVSVCVHAVVGKDGVVLQLLPWNHRAWHCGKGPNGSGNNLFVSLEMTEPATIKYTNGSNWIELSDGSNTKSHVLATYKHAVDFFSFIAKEFGFDPLNSNNLISHSEGNKRGIASAHSDVEHLWSHFGLTMNQFRADVKNAMVGSHVNFGDDIAEKDTAGQIIKPLNGTLTIIYKGYDGLNVRKTPTFGDNVDQVVTKGTYTVVGISADEKWYKLKSGLYITTIPDYVTFKATKEQKQSTSDTGYFRVRKSWTDTASQIGAFKTQENAIALCKHNSGYAVFDNNGVQIYPDKPANVPCMVKIKVDNLRIRKGPGSTYDYWKDQGKTRYTGKGDFTIVKESDGPGASKWGLLKYYADHGIDGWISLDAEFVERV